MNNPIKGWLRIPLLAALLLTAVPSAWATVYVRIQPPSVRLETHEQRRGYVWQSGYWRWKDNQHVWTQGRHVRAKQGHRWTNGRWENDKRGYFWVSGRWER